MKSKFMISLTILLIIIFAGCNPAEKTSDKKNTEVTEGEKAEDNSQISTGKTEDQLANEAGESEEQAENKTEETKMQTEGKAEGSKGSGMIKFSSIEDLVSHYKWIDAEGGMKYQDVKVGTGMEVKENYLIEAYYTLWLPDGKAFQSNKYLLEGASPAQMRPFKAQLAYGSLIDGWVKLVQGMKAGGVRRLIIPSEFAYGPNDSNGIPGGSTLVFELEIVDVTPTISEEQAKNEKLPISFNSIEELEKQFDWLEAEGGMKYLDVKVGNGRTVKEGDAITAFYTLWMPDGKPFQSNRYLLEDGDPSQLVPFESVLANGRLITGWVKLVQGMKDGGVRRLIIPSDYAYGPEDNRGIPGGSTLVFELEIVKSKAVK